MVRVEQHEDLYLLQELITKTAFAQTFFLCVKSFWIKKAKCNAISQEVKVQVRFYLIHLPDS